MNWNNAAVTRNASVILLPFLEQHFPSWMGLVVVSFDIYFEDWTAGIDSVIDAPLL